MTRALWLLIFAWLPLAAGAETEELTHQILSFDDLQSWAEDDHDQALDVFLNTCPDLKDPDWSALCALAQQKPAAKALLRAVFPPGPDRKREKGAVYRLFRAGIAGIPAARCAL